MRISDLEPQKGFDVDNVVARVSDAIAQEDDAANAV